MLSICTAFKFPGSDLSKHIIKRLNLFENCFYDNNAGTYSLTRWKTSSLSLLFMFSDKPHNRKKNLKSSWIWIFRKIMCHNGKLKMFVTYPTDFYVTWFPTIYYYTIFFIQTLRCCSEQSWKIQQIRRFRPMYWFISFDHQNV